MISLANIAGMSLRVVFAKKLNDVGLPTQSCSRDYPAGQLSKLRGEFVHGVGIVESEIDVKLQQFRTSCCQTSTDVNLLSLPKNIIVN